MRKALVCVIAAGVIAFTVIPADARTKLSGEYTQGQVDLACINAGGQVTSGSGSGGFGCKTGKVEISCTKTGTLNQGPVGTCTACKPSCSMDAGGGTNGAGTLDGFLSPRAKVQQLEATGDAAAGQGSPPAQRATTRLGDASTQPLAAQ